MNAHDQEIERIKEAKAAERKVVINDVLKIIDEVAADALIDDAIKINSVRNRVKMWLEVERG